MKIVNRTEFRVRYGETDKMGIVHHATYPLYFEMGRTEFFRQIGMPYTQLEGMGIMMPLTHMSARFIIPAIYDDLLVVETSVLEFTQLKIVMGYRIVDKSGKIITTGETTLISMDSQSRRPKRIPLDIYLKINQSINQQ